MSMCIWRVFYFTGEESPLLPSHLSERLCVLPSNRVLSEVHRERSWVTWSLFLFSSHSTLIFPIGGNAMACLKEQLRELPTRLNSSITAFGNSFPSFLKTITVLLMWPGALLNALWISALLSLSMTLREERWHTRTAELFRPTLAH